MKLSEIILDKIADTKLFEMARSRKDAKTITTGLSAPIIQHLIKLFVFNSPENKQHWIKEIDSWITQIDDIYLKPSNKKPDWQTLYDWIVFDGSPHYDADYLNGRVRKWVNHDYSGVEVYDYDADLVLSQIFKIIENLTKDIAIPNKFISIKEFLP